MLPFTSLAHHHPLGGCVIGSTNRKRYPTFKTKHPTLPYLSPSKALYPNPDCEIDKVKVRCIAPNSQNTKHVLSASTQNMFSILRVGCYASYLHFIYLAIGIWIKRLRWAQVGQGRVLSLKGGVALTIGATYYTPAQRVMMCQRSKGEHSTSPPPKTFKN